MSDSSRFWLAAALASLSVPTVFIVQALYAGSGFGFPFLAYFAAIAAVSYVGFLVLGLPFVLLLRARGRLSFGAILLGGIAAGPLFFIFLWLWSGEPAFPTAEGAQVVVVFTGLTATVAATFGVIAKARIRQALHHGD